MSSTVLIWTLVAIVASSLLGVFFSRRKKDPCLSDFRNYHVTVQHKNGKRV
ncbi:MAG: LPXTG cell wall anchor domain-containing protein [SAR202 cluster bacterium]|nr:LPXTG cell wall anchor domain-containing protein [SAR202 cluster bacterium]